ncbi:MAG: hypothetical protein AAF657_05010 [Acidobacteriota bacterium]
MYFKPLRSLALLAAISVLLPLAGCGKKGDPLPPLSQVPLTTKDLKVRQQGRLILLDMSYPNVTMGGMSLGGIDAVELLEMVKPAPGHSAVPQEGEEPKPLPSADAREFEASARELLTLRGAELNAAVVGDRIQFRLPLAEQQPDEPVANIFGVRTIKGQEVSAVSNRVTLISIEPPPAPNNLRAEAQPDGIALQWDAADDPQGFDIFRREAQLRGYGDPIRRVKGEARRFKDAGARYDKRYIYTVRAVANEEPLIHSDPAGEREIEYEDRFPPPLPRNLVALAERASVRLRWEASAAQDVAGYILYRREPGRDFHRLNDQLVQRTEYLDRNLASGLTYAYRIQVVDRNGNESEISTPVETTAR